MSLHGSSNTILPVDHSNFPHLRNGDAEEAGGERIGSYRRKLFILIPDHYVAVFILCFVNLINYMDRYTIAGILPNIKDHFGVGDDKGGLLQTAFVLSYMIFAPLFGYLGDRYNRKLIMAFGVFLWSLTTLMGSYMSTYYPFLLFRTFVGIGEASYSTIAPTIISDLFVRDARSKMLALFYFAIPVGSGLGYIVGSEAARIAGNWQWGLRVTPIFGMIAVLLILLFMEEPARGHSEGIVHNNLKDSTWSNDIKELTKNRSFLLSTIGFTCVAFVAGALAWWGPNFILLGLKLQPGYENTELNTVSYTFGIITMLSGLIGVPLGAYLSQRLKPHYEYIDPVICGLGLLFSAPLLFIGSILASKNIVLCYCFVFFGEICLNLNWSIVADILLYVVAPARRSTAEALQILISHAFGDAGSPYLIGLLSEFFKMIMHSKALVTSTAVVAATTAATTMLPPLENLCGSSDTSNSSICFKSLQYALFTTSFVEVIGALFFFLCALHIVHDKKIIERQLQGEDNPVVFNDTYTDVTTPQRTIN